MTCFNDGLRYVCTLNINPCNRMTGSSHRKIIQLACLLLMTFQLTLASALPCNMDNSIPATISSSTEQGCGDHKTAENIEQTAAKIVTCCDDGLCSSSGCLTSILIHSITLLSTNYQSPAPQAFHTRVATTCFTPLYRPPIKG